MADGVRWSAILTGAPDSTTDLDLRVSNLTMSLRESTYSFISLIVDPSQQEDVQDRPNGEIEIYRTELPDGSPELIVSGNQQQPRIDHGGGSRSYTLTATTSDSFTPFTTVSVLNTDIESIDLDSDGLYKFTLDPEINILPGDTLDHYADGIDLPQTSYVIDLVTIRASASGTTLSAKEAAV
jgi:hypothetical protein